MSVSISTSAWQSGFLNILPAIQNNAQILFRRLPAEQRREAIQEAIAAAAVSYQVLAAKGKVHVAHPSTLAIHAVHHVRSGRHVGGSQEAARDVMSSVVRRRHGIKLAFVQCDGLQNMLTASGRTGVPDLAAFRVDFDQWFSSFPRRDQKIITSLASGECTKAVAQRFGISPARVSQRRRQYERRWLVFQGEPLEVGTNQAAA
jgi:DNA-binding NarL/FixJ family response regulator